MQDLNNLYRQVIMDHYKNPRNKGLVNDEKYHQLHVKNPSCGDDVTLQLKIEDGIIKDIRHSGSGCSICCSSSSVMSELLIGKSIKEANVLINRFYDIIKGNEIDDPDSLEEAIVYTGVSKFPARVKCATLAWRACDAILAGEKGEKTDDESE